MKTQYFFTAEGESFSITEGFEREDIIKAVPNVMRSAVTDILGNIFYTKQEVKEIQRDAESYGEELRDRMIDIDEYCTEIIRRIMNGEKITKSDYLKYFRTISGMANQY